ncbi:MAG TPA: glycosyltransferase family 87 protein, partial [Dehalococcoidia bacterium]|nr:glycosyltransferase family 87 protein [Dehalococcoidia bacterium]
MRLTLLVMSVFHQALRRNIKQDTASALRRWWASHGTMVLRLAVPLMAVAAVIWLGYEFWRLLWQATPIWKSSPVGAVDLRILHEWVRGWFAGRPLYWEQKGVTYPPATYVILWPLLGWLEVTPARWVWAATSAVALLWLVYLIVRESGASTRLERVFVALLPLSMYATGATVGNGQLIVHLLPALVAGLVLLRRERRGWRTELLGAALVLFSLVKPSVSIPFFWVVSFVPGTLRPALLVSLGYIALTLLAASFQDSSLLMLLSGWLEHVSKKAVGQKYAYANLHTWLANFGLEEWNLPASILVLAFLGTWTYCYRHAELWLLVGVTALVARFWTYHAWYDDLLILLPMVTLFRIAKRSPLADGGDVAAGVLLALTALVTLAPGGLYLLPPPWKTVYVAGQITDWILVLVFLL